MLSGQVAWAGVQDATTADAIAMYFAGDDVDTTTPLKLKWAFASSKTHLLDGNGTCRSVTTTCFTVMGSLHLWPFSCILEDAAVHMCLQVRCLPHLLLLAFGVP